jgi:xylan 1,4-beta-xylosidase
MEPFTMKNLLRLSTTLVLLAGPVFAATPATATFTDIRYESRSQIDPGSFNAALHFENPILPGFYPDPSIERVGSDYYLVASTFAYFPGIPVWHSKDLVNWTQIGNAIDRPGQLDFSGLATSRGVFAPAISHHAGTFYIVNTCADCKGNFVITAKNPKGPWSDPVRLPFGGIDPSIFWDVDGRAYILWNDAPQGAPLYNGHRAIYMQEFDPKALAMKGSRQLIVNGGVDISTQPSWIEAPHIYKVDGWYYLMAAEGGTSVNHSEVILRSKDVWGPYEPWRGNPILTQRDLDPSRPRPVTSAGHADLVQTPRGDWYAVFLATQPYSGDLYNIGRETFLLPVQWRTEGDGKWPVILDRGAAIPLIADLPRGVGRGRRNSVTTSGYDAMSWLQVRTPRTPFLTAQDKGKTVTLQALPEAFGDVRSAPAFTGQRQQHVNARFATRVDFKPRADGDRAGILALQSDNSYIFFGHARREGREVLEVTRRAGRSEPRDGVVLASIDFPGGKPTLEVTITGGTARFSYDKNRIVVDNVDVTNLSTSKAGGFVGTLIGLYAHGQNP